MQLVSVCDIDPERIKWAKENLKGEIKYFDNSEEFYKNSILLIWWLSQRLTIPIRPFAIERALSITKRVLTEKPAGVYTKQVRLMNEAAEKSDKKFFIMYNQRTNCVYRKLRDLVKSGEVGDLKRMVWIITTGTDPSAIITAVHGEAPGKAKAAAFC